MVVEDALAGVEAGRAGGFALVIGVDRGGQAEELAAHGAHLVVADLGELLADSSEDVHRAGPRTHRLRAAAQRIIAATGDYPADPWRLVERAYNPTYVEQTETLFALSNGYLGMRGSFDEGEPAAPAGTLLNGFHETWPIVYPETAHGFATTGQTILPVPDGTADPAVRRRRPSHLRHRGGARVRRERWTCSGACSADRRVPVAGAVGGSACTANASSRSPSATSPASATR